MEIIGQTIEGPVVTMGLKNDGKIAENTILDYLRDLTGHIIQPLQNCSNQGCDGVFIDEVTKTIYVFEIKSSQNGISKAKSAVDDPATKLAEWVRRSLRSWKESQPATNKALADKLEDALIKGTYQVKGVEVKVGVPKPGETGATNIQFGAWGAP